MPRVWRVMTVDGDRPKVGPTARTLGVRAPPSRYGDIVVEADGTVGPGRGGMSVALAWRDLPRHRIPARLQSELPSAAGSNKDACWRMGEGAFEAGPIGSGLQLRPDSPKHGVVEPSATVPVATYQADLAATRDRWVVDEE